MNKKMDDRQYLEDYNLDGEIDKCPVCHKSMHPTYIDHRRIAQELVVIYICPSCSELLICIYKQGEIQSNLVVYWNIDRYYPIDLNSHDFSEIIKEISPEFCNIYNESIKAESMGLNEICGVGYRKALEFLVKHYAIYKYPEEQEKIGKRPLKQCIDSYIEYPKIKACATAATFLGNDETHYIRKFENKDVNDLKRLINMTVAWIDLVEQTERDMQEMGL